MNFFKNIFGSGKKEESEYTNFQEGDIFYTEKNNVYQIFKVLKYDRALETLHLKMYNEVSELPNQGSIKNLEVRVHHFPVDINGFDKPKLLTRMDVCHEDLLGYREYIKQTQNTGEIVKFAKRYYQEAYQLTDQGDHEGAILLYSQAIDLIPNFFEAIDNRAFCKMDLGKWKEAIEGFNQSLKVNPNSLLAIFSIGECYLRLEEYSKAKEYFEKAIQVDPNHQNSIKFLKRTVGLMQK